MLHLWNKGYCTKAARAVLSYAFEDLGLNRVHASFLKRNPASGRVMEKIGMRYEGCMRQHTSRWEAFEDLVMYGIVKCEHETHEREGRGR
jgi:RimJ/RimL family protein N-acetyltransferase